MLCKKWFHSLSTLILIVGVLIAVNVFANDIKYVIDKDDDRCTMTVLAGSATISSNHSDQASKMPLNFMFGGISGDKLFNNDKLYCLPADQGLMLSFEKGGFYETACEERSGSRRMNGMELYRYVFSAKDYTMEIRVGPGSVIRYNNCPGIEALPKSDKECREPPRSEHRGDVPPPPAPLPRPYCVQIPTPNWPQCYGVQQFGMTPMVVRTAPARQQQPQVYCCCRQIAQCQCYCFPPRRWNK